MQVPQGLHRGMDVTQGRVPVTQAVVVECIWAGLRGVTT